jgi:superfamily II DNA or RNA helicase
MLDALFGAPSPTPDRASLTAFQATAVDALRRIIERRGGAILADSVGLGKTHIARALIEERVAVGGDALVLAPSALIPHWQHQLRSCTGVRVVSHATMSRSGAPPLLQSGRALVVVDEAHAFRNPAIRRYRALAALAATADVLLVTATPVNNSVHDFLHLVRLFAPDDAFADVGAPSLLSAAELAAAGSAEPLRRVVPAVMVRRTRELIERVYTSAVPQSGPATLRFPRRESIRRVHYDLEGCCAGGIAEIAGAVRRLSFPAYAPAGAVPAELLQLGLLKRLESSTHAFRASLAAHRRLLQEFSEAARHGFLLDAHTCRVLMPVVGDAVQLTIRAVALPEWPLQLDRDELIARAREEDSILDMLLQRLDCSPGDPKADALAALLNGELQGEQVLVFTQFRDTGRALWHRFRRAERVALIDGAAAHLGESRSSRRTVIQRFAPRANGARVPAPREAVRILVATDVLAEGLNLQDARVVVSYDLPWNPVRLAQRIGRIDRLGSPHERVIAFAFMPAAGLDDLLGLVRRLRRKLRHIQAVGGDAPRFSRIHDVIGDDELQQRERLRIAHADLPPPPPGTTADVTVTAAVMVDSELAGALFCIDDGVSASLVLVPDRGPARIEPDSVWKILEAALQTGNGAQTGSRIHRLRRRAFDAWHRAIADPPQRVSPAAQRAARLLHDWLDRDPHRDRAACETADAALAWLACPQLPTADHALESALRGGATIDQRVRAICDLARTAPSPAIRSTPRVVAVLELVPVSAPGSPPPRPYTGPAPG